MSQQSMDDFFRMVGFDPDSIPDEAQWQSVEDDDSAKESDAASDEREGSGKKKRRRKRGSKKERRSESGKRAKASGGRGVDWKQVVENLHGGSGSGGTPHFVWENNPFARWSRRRTVIVVVVIVAIILLAYWWFHPPLNIHSTQFWLWLFIIVLIPSFVVFRTLSWKSAKKQKVRQADGSVEVAPPRNAARAKTYRYISYVPLAVALLFVVGTLAMFSFWPGNAARYSSILQVQEGDFAEEIEEADYSTIPVIDRASAVILGNRTLGEIADYVSQFEISSVYSQINYQDTPVRVSPLNYADIFKWFNNVKEGIPAYVLVDMTTQDTQIVRLEEGMHYVESDPLFNNIDRYVQLKYPTYYFEEKSFEIDEDGTPWWVCPVQTRTIGLFGGETITRVVLVNACTGETADYAISDCPDWVDRAYPSDLLVQQYNWRGSLSNGWLNSIIGQKGVVQTTPGSDGELGYNYIAQDDDVWLYTGVTSATSDDAIVGFVLVNQRTAEANYYSVAGATEESAMDSAEGQVQNLEYDATFPLLLNIDGQPTYFMALKDSAGLVKKFAMLDIQRYQNVAVGDTVAECQESYEALLITNGAIDAEEAVDSGALKLVTGTIATMTEAVIDGDSHIYLTLEGDGMIYDCALTDQIEIVAYQVGDKITLSYVEDSPTSTVQALGDDAVALSEASEDEDGDDSDSS